MARPKRILINYYIRKRGPFVVSYLSEEQVKSIIRSCDSINKEEKHQFLWRISKHGSFKLNNDSYIYDEGYNSLTTFKEREKYDKEIFHENSSYSYRITRIGHIYRKDKISREETQIKGTYNDKGLHYAVIDKKKYLIAKLVYDTYGESLSHIKNGVIMYRDENKRHCSIENLSYVNRSEFNKYRTCKRKRKNPYKKNAPSSNNNPERYKYIEEHIEIEEDGQSSFDFYDLLDL